MVEYLCTFQSSSVNRFQQILHRFDIFKKVGLPIHALMTKNNQNSLTVHRRRPSIRPQSLNSISS